MSVYLKRVSVIMAIVSSRGILLNKLDTSNLAITVLLSDLKLVTSDEAGEILTNHQRS